MDERAMRQAAGWISRLPSSRDLTGTPLARDVTTLPTLRQARLLERLLESSLMAWSFLDNGNRHDHLPAMLALGWVEPDEYLYQITKLGRVALQMRNKRNAGDAT